MFLQGIYRVYLEKLDQDGGKEGGQEEGSQNKGTHIAGTERGDADKDREGAGKKQVTNHSEGSKEKNSDTSTDKEVKDLSLPRTTEETFQQYKLVFYDVNTVSRLVKTKVNSLVVCIHVSFKTAEDIKDC